MKKIVSFFGEPSPVFDELNRRAESYAAEKGFAYRWVPQKPFDQAQVIQCLQESDMGLIDVEPYGEEIFRAIDGKCPLLVRFGVGYDKVDLAAATRHGIAVARTTGANASGVAEMALTLILACRRELRPNRFRCIETGRWDKYIASETAGGTVGILGFGAIGRLLAKLLLGLGCTVIAYDPFPNQALAQEMGVRLVDLDELFTTSDAISVHVPYNPDTHHMVNAARLAQMKPTSVIVNTARGNIIDEDAGLDVYTVEPLPAESKLLELDNLILSPHFSSQTVESLWNTYKMAIDITVDFYAGNPSPHILNPEYKTRRV